jgi:site-specific DNA-cytosine methylase
MRERVFTFIAPFGGSGLGARGFLDASIRLPGFDITSRFECLGGIDIDPLACADFKYLTGVDQLCADISKLAPADIRKAFGERAPDVVFSSAPCQGASGLLSSAKAATEKYQKMNDLSIIWARLMITAWTDPPSLLLFENVPRLVSRAPEMLRELKRMLKRAGYVLTDGFHDCGELGALAQHRRRWLLVARHPRKCPPLLYQPPKRRVRGCGEVLGQLPVPATVEAAAWGPMHVMPKLAWVNWLRLALIPAGGDHRDLEGVLAEGQARRELFKRHAVESWDEPVGTVAADTGSNGVANVADPRVSTGYDAAYGVLGWDEAARTVATKTGAGCGAYAVADPRLGCEPRSGAYGVIAWYEASNVVTGSLNIDNGFGAIADPRKPPDFTPVIIAADGTWHRPLTTLELAALQGFPLMIDGKPLRLAGKNTRMRKAIGNAVPAPAARAIAEQMLVALTEGALGEFSMRSGAVWVEPAEARQ